MASHPSERSLIVEEQVRVGDETTVDRDRYEMPELVKVGDVVELTNGASFNDTADRKVYYY